MPPVIFLWALHCARDNVFPPRRALRDTPPPHRTTHANYVCAGPGGGGGHSGVVPFWYIAFYYCDHPGTTTHENCIFAGPGIVPPLRRGELYPATVRTKFPSIGGVGAARGGKRFQENAITPPCHREQSVAI